MKSPPTTRLEKVELGCSWNSADGNAAASVLPEKAEQPLVHLVGVLTCLAEKLSPQVSLFLRMKLADAGPFQFFFPLPVQVVSGLGVVIDTGDAEGLGASVCAAFVEVPPL